MSSDHTNQTSESIIRLLQLADSNKGLLPPLVLSVPCENFSHETSEQTVATFVFQSWRGFHFANPRRSNNSHTFASTNVTI
uniref:Uncharacterized protein n=1 Tax=Oryza barthii TaxID=65489 RepID=A0A0D3GKA4_9ORYZ